MQPVYGCAVSGGPEIGGPEKAGPIIPKSEGGKWRTGMCRTNYWNGKCKTK